MKLKEAFQASKTYLLPKSEREGRLRERETRLSIAEEGRRCTRPKVVGVGGRGKPPKR